MSAAAVATATTALVSPAVALAALAAIVAGGAEQNAQQNASDEPIASSNWQSCGVTAPALRRKAWRLTRTRGPSMPPCRA